MPPCDAPSGDNCPAVLELQVRLERLRNRLDSLRNLTDDLGEWKRRCEVLQTQLRGGYRDVDPRTEPDHPGHVLIRLGWEFVPEEPGDPDDEIGAYWRDPEEKGTGQHTIRSLPSALSIACRRLLDKACKTRLERLVGEDDG